jgi:hypothetical protein
MRTVIDEPRLVIGDSAIDDRGESFVNDFSASEAVLLRGTTARARPRVARASREGVTCWRPGLRSAVAVDDWDTPSPDPHRFVLDAAKPRVLWIFPAINGLMSLTADAS